MARLDAKTLTRAIDTGERAGTYAERFNLFTRPTPLSKVIQFVRTRLYDNSVGTFLTTRYARVREDAIFAALSAMQSRFPAINILDEQLSTDDIERVRRLTTAEQRRVELDRDRIDVDALIKRDEQRLADWNKLRVEKRLEQAAPKQMTLL